ncbi:MAG: LamG domain-containing protein [Candidatus Aenigmarchaeota archaeon]|nr:LamG domain-containing protein [Candidatus Aenigmarchaeota archaeon]
MKAITPVIALVMLMLITVGIVGVSAAWFSGFISTSTGKNLIIPAGGAFCTNSEIKVYALNNGNDRISAQDIIVAQIDGNDILNTPFFGDISSGLVGNWKLDEGSGSTTADSSTYGNTGTLVNNPQWVAGKSGKALRFDGTNYVRMNNNLDIGSNPANGPITISLWFKPEITSQYQMLFSDNFLELGLSINKGSIDNKLYGWSYQNAPSSAALSPNQWYYGTVVFDKNNLKVRLYLNGIFQSETSVTIGNGLNDAPFAIAADYQGGTPINLFKGTIDEVEVHNKIKADININPGESALLVNYPGTEGAHSIRIGTAAGVVETSVTCY